MNILKLLLSVTHFHIYLLLLFYDPVKMVLLEKENSYKLSFVVAKKRDFEMICSSF